MRNATTTDGRRARELPGESVSRVGGTLPADWQHPSAHAWPPRVRAVTTSRRGPAGQEPWNLADHVGDDPAAVAANRRTLLELTGLTRVQWLAQVHGRRCVAATASTAAGVPEADAAWTDEPGLGLAVLTADCVPAVICDRAGSVVGVAHGGWRGLVGGVLESLVAALPVPAADLVAWLGPAIGPQAYEVGDDVRAALAALPDGRALAGECLRPGRASGKHHLDLFTLSERLLARVGVATVPEARCCTFGDRRFFSYRREGRTGRMVTLAWLQPGRSGGAVSGSR